jgi:hypothetical protein
MPENGPTPSTDDGPMPLPSDPWDFDPNADLPNETYRGVRRALARRGPRPLVIGIVIALVGAALAWFGLSGGAGRTSPDLAGGGLTPTSPGPLDTTAGPSAAAPTSPAPTPTAVRTTPGDTSSPTTRPFATLVFEAEAGPPSVKLRSARVVAENGASGGQVVQITNDSGEIQFRSIAIPTAGTYTFSVYYAPGHAGSVGSLTVGNDAPVDVSFVSGSGCCLVTTVRMTLPPGTYTANLRISNPGGDGPAIDRMSVSRG